MGSRKKGKNRHNPRVGRFKVLDLVSMANITFGSDDFKKYAAAYAKGKNTTVEALSKPELLSLYQKYLGGQ